MEPFLKLPLPKKGTKIYRNAPNAVRVVKQMKFLLTKLTAV